MKTISTDLLSSFTNEVTTLCRLLEIKKTDNTSIYLTDGVVDIMFEGDLYLSSPGFDASSVQTELGSTEQGLNVKLFCNDTSVIFSDIFNGKINNTITTLSIVDYMNLDYGQLILFKGKNTNWKMTEKGSLSIEIGSQLKSSSYISTQIYSPICRADFGDSKCKFPIETLAKTITISSLTSSNQKFNSATVTEVLSYWTLGTLQWLTGNNTGIAHEIMGSTPTGGLSLFLPPPSAVMIGDTAKIWPGCDKSLKMCFERYANNANFRGEPYMALELSIPATESS